MPSLRPISPDISPRVLLIDFDFDVDTGRKIQLGERVDRLWARIDDVDHALVGLELELLAALLVDVRRAEHRPALNAGRQRDRPAHARARLLGRAYDIRGRLIDHRVIERLQSDSDLAGHVCLY